MTELALTALRDLTADGGLKSTMAALTKSRTEEEFAAASASRVLAILRALASAPHDEAVRLGYKGAIAEAVRGYRASSDPLC